MAKKKTVRNKTVRKQTARRRTVKAGTARRRAKSSSRPAKKAAPGKAAMRNALLDPVRGATSREVGHVRLDVGRAGGARVKRMIYPPGFRWSVDMQPAIGTPLCMHAHVGFLAHGEIHIEYPDGCIVEHKAPQIVAIDPGHDGWVVGDDPVVLIEFDFEGDTVDRLGMPRSHSH